MYSADGKTIGYSDDQPFIDYFTRYQKWYDNGYILSLDKEAQKKGVAEEDEIVAQQLYIRHRLVQPIPRRGQSGNRSSIRAESDAGTRNKRRTLPETFDVFLGHRNLQA